MYTGQVDKNVETEIESKQRCLAVQVFFYFLFEETRFSDYYVVNKYYPGHAISFLIFSYHKEQNPSL